MGNAASTVPYGAQISAVNASLHCKNENTYTGANLAFVSTTAPLTAGSGQQIYFSDVTANVKLNPLFAASALDIGPYYEANLTITFDVTNASPSTFSIFTSVTQKNPLTVDYSYPVPFQPAGAVLGPFGPFTLGAAGQTADLRIQSVIGNIYYRFDNATGPRSQAFPLSCDASTQRFEYIVSSVAIDSSSGPALQPANGVPGSFPPTPVGTRANTANFPISCKENESIESSTRAFNFTASGTGPAYVKPGQVYNFTNLNTYFTAPGDLIANLDGFYGTKGHTYLVAIEGLNTTFNLANTSPSSYDASRDFTASDSSTPDPLRTGRYVDGGSSNPVGFPLPNWGYLTLPNSTVVNQVKSNVCLALQGFQGRISSTDTRQGLSGSEIVTCSPNSQSFLLSAPIIDASIAVDKV